MRRATKEAWCRAGLSLLRNEGDESLTVERLCTALRKTKGSFYHHFADLDAYLIALLAVWEHEHTERPIEVSQRVDDVQQRGERLSAEVRKLDHRLDRAVRAWARRNSSVRASLKKIDARRLGYLMTMHAAAKHPNPKALAEIEYAGFVGLQHLDLLDEPKHAAQLVDLLNEALMLLARKRAGRTTSRKGQ